MSKILNQKEMIKFLTKIYKGKDGVFSAKQLECQMDRIVPKSVYFCSDNYFYQRLQRLVVKGFLICLLLPDNINYYALRDQAESFDLSDPDERKIASDWYEDKGRLVLAEFLRKAKRGKKKK